MKWCNQPCIVHIKVFSERELYSVISLKLEILVQTTSLTPPHFIEVLFLRQKSKRLCIRVVGVSVCVFFYDFVLLASILVWWKKNSDEAFNDHSCACRKRWTRTLIATSKWEKMAISTTSNKLLLTIKWKTKNITLSELGTGLPVSMYTTKTPIDKWFFNVTHVKEFF
jgi:hypothetical protein